MNFQAIAEIPTSVRKWKSYPSYTDSGIKWLGAVPSHWRTWKLSHAFEIIGSGTTPPSDEPQWYDGDVPWVTTGELRESRIQSTDKCVSDDALRTFSTLRVYPAGTLLIAMYGATIGRLGLLDVSACTNQACCALSRSDVLDNTFVFYWLQAFREQIIYLASGGGQPNINQEEIKSLRVPAPPLTEQHCITTLLDRETAKIDALVAKKKRLIELLQEKRVALITRAVTKGLAPNMPMKDSGVEWLGEIPAHWEVKQIRNIAKSLQTGPFGSQLHSEDYIPGGIPVINPSHLRDGRIVPDADCAVDRGTALRLSHHELCEGDIIFGRRGEMGRCALVTKEEVGWLCGTGSLCIRPNLDLVYPPFVNRFLSISGIREWLLLEAVGATMDNLNTTILGRMPVLVPPLDKQRALSSFCDSEATKIDALIAKIREGIEKLKEYRTALISAAVTGKIDVRTEA